MGAKFTISLKIIYIIQNFELFWSLSLSKLKICHFDLLILTNFIFRFYINCEKLRFIENLYVEV